MNPKKVLNAFCTSPISIGEITLHPLKLGHILALEKIGNPLAAGRDVTVPDLLQALAIISLPSADARALAGNPDALAARALELEDSILPRDMLPLAEAVKQLFAAAFATALPAAAPEGELSAPTAKQAASVGASGQSPTSPLNSQSRPSTRSTSSTPRKSSHSAPPRTPPTAANSPAPTTSKKNS